MTADLDLEELFAKEWNDLIPSCLANGKVLQVDLYKLSPANVSAGGAFLVRISKRLAENKEEALIYLLQKLLLYSELLPASPPYPNGSNFLKLVREQQVLSNAIGKPASTDQVGRFYEELESEARKTAGSDYLLNGQELNATILNKNDILSCVVFIDDWNEKVYLMETRDDWWLLSWGMDV